MDACISLDWYVYMNVCAISLDIVACKVSDSSVHSHICHLKTLLETTKEASVPHTYIHFFGNGCDTAPALAKGYIEDLLSFIKSESYSELVTVVS